MSRPVMTHAEMAEAIREAVKNVPKLGKLDWKTIYLSLTRERRRIAQLVEEFESNLDVDASPELRMFRAKLTDQLAHINKILVVLGEQGRNMLLRVDEHARLECAGKQGTDCPDKPTYDRKAVAPVVTSGTVPE